MHRLRCRTVVAVLSVLLPSLSCNYGARTSVRDANVARCDKIILFLSLSLFLSFFGHRQSDCSEFSWTHRRVSVREMYRA